MIQKTIQCWSGGKDSTASIILEHIHGLPPSDIVFSEVMFDKKRGISGETPEHIDFVKKTAIPIFESWGHKVEVLHANKDYLDLFYHVITRSKIPERNGKIRGFPIGGMCIINPNCKISPINKYYRALSQCDVVQYVGIAADEPKRLERLKGTNKISLLKHYGYNEKMAYDLCREYGLLSPMYDYAKRGGCWFCPNATIRQFARVKQFHPALWSELEKLSRTDNLVSQNFSYGKSFDEVDREVDMFIKREEFERAQMTFDTLDSFG